MPRKVDQDVLLGFFQEAKGYLPHILEDLAECHRAPDQVERLEEAHRHVHTIKGASSMVGLSGLSHIAYQLEEALDDLANGKLTLTDDAYQLMRSTVGQIEAYLDGTLAGTLREGPLLEAVTRGYRRLRGLPEEEDSAAVAQVLAAVQDGASPAPAAPAEEDEDLGVGAVPAGPAPVRGPDLNLMLAEDSDLDRPKAPTAPKPAPVMKPEPIAVEPIQDDVAPELVEVFAAEAEDHLRNIATLLPQLRQDPGNRDHLQGIRRSAHTLKGSAAMVGFKTVTHLAHRMEDLLDLLFEGEMGVTPDILELLFASADALEDLTASKGDAVVIQGLYARYAALLGTRTGAAAAVTPAPTAAPAAIEQQVIDLPEPPRPAEAEPREAAAKAGHTQYVRIPIERLDELVKMVSELVIARTAFEQKMADFARQIDELAPSITRLRRTAYKLETQYEASALARTVLVPAGTAPARVAVPAGNGRQDNHPPSSAYSMVMSVASQGYGFDELEFDRYTEFHLVSRELVETTTDIQTVTGEMGHILGDFDTYLNRQGRLTSEIEDKLMRLRMVPLSTLTNRLQRTVRNVAQQQGKQVDLVLEGEATELDKNVLEEMSETLLHLLRNAVDHGIEPPELRQVKGKSARGLIRLRAFQEGSYIVLQISDDGNGIEPQNLRATAVAKGFLGQNEAGALSDEEALDLIFLPGFSTASQISEVSGRGVGMDIVRNNVHKLKGTLTLQSTPGAGTTFTIRLPLTLAITRALLVKAAGQTFALPLEAVRQIVRLEPGQVEKVGNEPVVRLGGQVLRLLTLNRVLNLRGGDELPERPPVLVLAIGNRQLAVVVEDLLGGREIVIKTLGSHLRRVPGVTGATLLGDGTVVLILNPNDWIRDAGGAAGAVAVKTTPRQLPAAVAPAAAKAAEAVSVLVVDDSPSVRRVVTNMLKTAGMKPVAAKDGLEALELLHQAPSHPDLILLDVEMPRMDGYELLSTLKGQDAYKPIPVVMVTSRAGEKHRRKALDMGANGYVVKPYQDDFLIGTIRQLVKESRR